jgi:hypothetical protein
MTWLGPTEARLYEAKRVGAQTYTGYIRVIFSAVRRALTPAPVELPREC